MVDENRFCTFSVKAVVQESGDGLAGERDATNRSPLDGGMEKPVCK